MKILTKKELLEAPAGTVYIGYEPEITDGEIKIKVGNNCNLDLIKPIRKLIGQLTI